MTSTHINPGELSRPTGYTHVVASNGRTTIYIAGQVAFDRDGVIVGPGDAKPQIEQVFTNLEIALAAAGATFRDVVKTTTFLVGMEHVGVLREVRERYLDRESPPASTVIGVQALVRPELLVEIEAVAVLP